jgi:hypothetical protein|tara:strand:+ start:3768 stop:3905 length:138 start_codon:yes stop_codon:yes gene_type:complete
MKEINKGMKELEEKNNKCSKCGKHTSVIEYKEKNYCTWYCAKKKS